MATGEHLFNDDQKDRSKYRSKMCSEDADSISNTRKHAYDEYKRGFHSSLNKYIEKVRKTVNDDKLTYLITVCLKCENDYDFIDRIFTNIDKFEIKKSYPVRYSPGTFLDLLH